LVVEHGRLHTQHSDIVDKAMREFFSSDPVLVFRYPEGDCDTIPWPMKKEHRPMLALCLYDDREIGVIPDVPSVILPDGSEFFIEAELKD
jgi:hypothetical protein